MDYSTMSQKTARQASEANVDAATSSSSTAKQFRGALAVRVRSNKISPNGKQAVSTRTEDVVVSLTAGEIDKTIGGRVTKKNQTLASRARSSQDSPKDEKDEKIGGLLKQVKELKQKLKLKDQEMKLKLEAKDQELKKEQERVTSFAFANTGWLHQNAELVTEVRFGRRKL